jgi:hypothetical protein
LAAAERQIFRTALLAPVGPDLTEALLSALNFDSSAPLLGGATKRPDKVLAGGAPPVAAPARAEASPLRDPVFIADSSAGADLLGLGEALQPIAQLCAHADSQTPLMIALVGPAGSGKSFALNRLLGAMRQSPASPAASEPAPARIVAILLDAAAVSGDPASAIAAATYQRFARDYPALAAEAAQSGADPEQAASMAAARNDEIQRKLDAEKGARDDIDGRRARLGELVLYQTPGSRIDAFARANRNLIEGRLRRFDLLAGDPIANFKDLIRDFSGAGGGSRLSIALRSIWSYRSQFKLLAWAAVSFALAFGLAKLANISASSSPRGFGTSFDAAADGLHAHSDWLEKGVAAFILLGVLLLFVNFWRSLTFSAMLFRGLRLLNSDLRDRRRDLDASSARLNQRVATLAAEADAAGKLAEATSRRVSGASRAALASPSPAFASAPPAPAVAARAFMAELGKLMGAANGAPGLPQRIVLALDNLDALPAGKALDLIESAHGLLGASSIAIVAFNPASLAEGSASPEALREKFERLFQITFSVQGPDVAEKARMVARLLGAGGIERSSGAGAAPTSLAEPLAASEATLLTALAPLACSTPRRAKRFLNIYRLARTSSASRPALALMLATQLSEDKRIIAEMDRLLRQSDPAFGDPKGPPALFEAVQAARAASDGKIPAIDAAQAMDVAQRYCLAI